MAESTTAPSMDYMTEDGFNITAFCENESDMEAMATCAIQSVRKHLDFVLIFPVWLKHLVTMPRNVLFGAWPALT